MSSINSDDITERLQPLLDVAVADNWRVPTFPMENNDRRFDATIDAVVASVVSKVIMATAKESARVRINRYHYEQGSYKYPLDAWLDVEAESTGKYYMLRNRRRYRQCRQAALDKPSVYSTGNLFDTDNTQKLAAPWMLSTNLLRKL